MNNIKSDNMVVKYGPHDFPGGPELYLRLVNHVDSERKEPAEAHSKIKDSLGMFFTDARSSSTFDNNYDNSSLVSLNFINYGNTALVYLARFNGNSAAVVINQPHTPLGALKNEFENLERLVEIDPRYVVKPKQFFSMDKLGHELYTAEYVPDALCVAHHNIVGHHGIYNPHPFYHFEIFSKELSSEINSGIIALLVNYYDKEKGRGLAKTQISGNDFILTKGKSRNKTYDCYGEKGYVGHDQNDPYKLKLIAARGFVDASLDEYCDLLKTEFLKGTKRFDEDVLSGKLLINHKSSLPMTKDEISKGIDAGLRMRSER